MLNLSLINKGDKILVALSGGADSVALLHALNSSNLDIELYACHLNHKTRGEESTRDLNFCKTLCKNLNIRFYFEEIEINIDKKIGFEATARNIRYDFFNRAITHFGADKIATAHNADDNLETILLNLCRGTGIDGLCGIPKTRDNIIRPILHKTRDEIEAYIKSINADFVEDSSNKSDDYSRNKIRNNCIPILKQINENIVKNTLNTSEIISKNNNYINCNANELYSDLVKENNSTYIIDINKAKELDHVILFKIVKKIVKNTENQLSNITFNEILNIINSKNPSAKLEKEFIVNREYENLIFKAKHNSELCTMQVNQNNITILTNMLDNLDIHYPISKFKIDFESLVLRKRETNDKIKTKLGTKLLKKAFIDMKIPQNKRDYIPILADKNGIISVCYLDIDQNRSTTNNEFEIIFRSI